MTNNIKAISALLLSLLICTKPAWGKPVTIYAPVTPSSIPLILAVEELSDCRVKIFTNHSQAHSLFIKGEIEMLSTGLAVGITFYRQGIPIRIINSYVSGLSYLVANKKIKDWSDLSHEKLWLPFAGSPLDEITRFFLEKEGLYWNRDINIGYAPFPSSVSLLQQGKLSAAILPEPFVSQLIASQKIHVVKSYKQLWQKHTGNLNGYPQVGTFVKKGWSAKNKDFINRLNAALEQAVQTVAKKPDHAVRKALPYFRFSETILRAALSRTDFHLLQGIALEREIKDYYRILGAPLDQTTQDFF